MNVKNFLTKVTSVKGVIVIVGTILIGYNELRLRILEYEIKEANRVQNEAAADQHAQQIRDLGNASQVSLAEFAEELSIQAGIVVDYGLIERNTEAAVKKGATNAMSYVDMLFRVEKDHYSYFELDKFNGETYLMRVTERPDSIPLFEEYMKIK